jgi:hypothetical protein
MLGLEKELPEETLARMAVMTPSIGPDFELWCQLLSSVNLPTNCVGNYVVYY